MALAAGSSDHNVRPDSPESAPLSPPAGEQQPSKRAKQDFNIVFRDQVGGEVHFKLLPNAKFAKVLQAYCSKKCEPSIRLILSTRNEYPRNSNRCHVLHAGISSDTMAFWFDGMRVDSDHTPAMLEMADGDVVDAVAYQTGDIGQWEALPPSVSSPLSSASSSAPSSILDPSHRLLLGLASPDELSTADIKAIFASARGPPPPPPLPPLLVPNASMKLALKEDPAASGCKHGVVQQVDHDPR